MAERVGRPHRDRNVANPRSGIAALCGGSFSAGGHRRISVRAVLAYGRVGSLPLVGRVRLRCPRRSRTSVASSDLTTCTPVRTPGARPSTGVPGESFVRGQPVSPTQEQYRLDELACQ